MSSFPRNLQRKAMRTRPEFEPASQPTRIFPDGSYCTLHPTKGWRFVGIGRIDAGRRMARMLDHALQPRRKKPPKLWRKPAKVPPGTLTRQRRRCGERKGQGS